MEKKSGYIILFILAVCISCKQNIFDNEVKVFESIAPELSGIDFANMLEYDQQLNAYTYRNFYNGAGVALGDINNDGLLDIYFAGNQVENKLYLNRGDFTFEDITETAGVACKDVWTTGVSMADVNGDGLLDIFVCKSGPPFGGVRHNELFINNGDLTFTESAAAWGVADVGLSIHAVFFDYDKDGDLDFYLLNNSNRSVGIYDLKIGQREVRDPYGGNKLYRNDGDRFTDVSEEAGIYGSAIGFGLGVTVADVNKDGWPDIFVSNDFFEKDYLYINNRNGTFTESLEQYINEISLGSMGADIADLNNDGYPEIYVTEMLPESLADQRTKTVFEDWDKYSANVAAGYYHQFTRNVLQLNNGPIPGDEDNVFFTEVSRYTKTHATDWSWGALIFDYNNDGHKDIFVANGIAKDLTDQDYINYYASSMLTSANLRKDSLLLQKLMDKIPVQPVPNYLFENKGNLTFESKAAELGLDLSGFSNGAAYGDLNNDGAIDLVVNNINSPATIYRNTIGDSNNSNYIQLKLIGKNKNTSAFGAQVYVYCDTDVYYVEQSPVKGYLSSVDHKLHHGLGMHQSIDSIEIHWSDGGLSTLYKIKANQLIEINENEIVKDKKVDKSVKKNFYFSLNNDVLNKYSHSSSSYNDFNKDRLLFEMISNEGPSFAVADFNGDGREDVFISGSANEAGSLWLQTAAGLFEQHKQTIFEEDKKADDVKAIVLDVNEDGQPDIYVASGGNQFSFGDFTYRDRIYINDGNANFVRQEAILQPADLRESTAFVLAQDINGNGLTDLIVGSRLIPFYYGIPANAWLLNNNGKGVFENQTISNAPGFNKLGLLRDAKLIDYDNDGDLDLIVVGEWMGVKVFNNHLGTFTDVSDELGLANSSGLWNTIVTGDFNNDGYIDFVVANHGLNSKYSALGEGKLKMYVSDFDENGNLEQIICVSIDGKDYPLALLPDLVKQIPSVKKKFQNFASYKDASMTDIFSEGQLSKAIEYEASVLESSLFLNNGKNGFERIALPAEAQFSKIYAMHSIDVNSDGNLDLVIAGNQKNIKPEMGSLNGSYGLLLKGLGDGTFEAVAAAESGLFVKGETRDIKQIKIMEDDYLLFLRRDDKISAYKINKSK
jgi:enediyne biosynthesis protein E4